MIPATYAYAGDLSSFAHRGQVMGRIVSGWSIAIVLVVPLMAIASQTIGWQAAFGHFGLDESIIIGRKKIFQRFAAGHKSFGHEPELGAHIGHFFHIDFEGDPLGKSQRFLCGFG